MRLCARNGVVVTWARWLEKLQLSLMHRNRPGKASSTPSLFFASHTSPPLTQDPSGEFAKPSIPGEDLSNST